MATKHTPSSLVIVLRDDSENSTFPSLWSSIFSGQPRLRNHNFISLICFKKFPFSDHIFLKLDPWLYTINLLVLLRCHDIKYRYWCFSVDLTERSVLTLPSFNLTFKSKMALISKFQIRTKVWLFKNSISSIYIERGVSETTPCTNGRSWRLLLNRTKELKKGVFEDHFSIYLSAQTVNCLNDKQEIAQTAIYCLSYKQFTLWVLKHFNG